MKYRVVFNDFKTFEEDGFPNEFERCIYIHRCGRIDSGRWTKNCDNISKDFAGFVTVAGYDLAEDIIAWSPLNGGKSQDLEEMLDIKEGASMEECLAVMTDALQEAMRIQEEMSKAMEELEAENCFLTDVIVENNLARQVMNKRKQLQQIESVNSGENIDEKQNENLSLAE